MIINKMDLYASLEEIFKQGKWEYYPNGHCGCFPICSKEESERFINEYFKAGSKEAVLSGITLENSENEEFKSHIQHTVVTFFLGILLKESLFKNYELSIKGNEWQRKIYPFNYLWFLICLFHDYGYYFKGNGSLGKTLYKRRQSIYRQQGIPNIKYTCRGINNGDSKVCEKSYFNIAEHGKQCPRKSDNSSIKLYKGKIIINGKNFSYDDLIVIGKPRYSSSLKTRYLRYMLEQRKELEHGILAADILFDRLLKNYVNKYCEYKKASNGKYSICYFELKNKFFICEQFKIWEYIGDCIASHNIWKCPEGCEELYKNYQLESLIGNIFKKIYFRDNPLLFILCLCDSIEPTKRTGNIDVLKELYFNAKDNGNSFSLVYRGSDEKILEHFKNLEKCSDWLGINVAKQKYGSYIKVDISILTK